MGKAGRYNRIMDTNGQSALEFVMVFPLVIILILAASQIGMAVYGRIVLQQASREAARIVSTTDSDSQAIEAARRSCGDDSEITIVPGKMHRRLGDMVTVRVSRKPGDILKIIEWITGKEAVLSAETWMRMECGGDDI